MLDVYGKDEKDDLTAGEKKQLKALVDELRAEAIGHIDTEAINDGS